MDSQIDRAKLIFLDEIAKRNAEAADLLRANPEALRAIIDTAVAALRESVQAGTSMVAESIRSIPRAESNIEALACLHNAVVVQGNQQQGLIKAVEAAVRGIRFPEAVQPVREWELIPERDYDTGLIRSVRVKAVG